MWSLHFLGAIIWLFQSLTLHHIIYHFFIRQMVEWKGSWSRLKKLSRKRERRDVKFETYKKFLHLPYVKISHITTPNDHLKKTKLLLAEETQ